MYATSSAPCPICKTPLRKLDFIKSKFEDVHVENECRQRRYISKIYNKQEEDFPDLRSYNDYLEEIEDLVFNRLNKIDVEETQQRIDKYKADNLKLIAQNEEKIKYEHSLERQAMDAERRDYKQRKDEDLRIVNEEVSDKMRKKNQIIDQMAASSKSAHTIIKNMIEDNEIVMKDANEMESIEKEVGADGKRGITITERLEQHRRNVQLLKQSETDTNPFESPLASKYARNATPFIKPTYDDPSVKALEQEQYIAGGFSSRTVYKKMMESFFMSIYVTAEE